jgi:hypothetical protein
MNIRWDTTEQIFIAEFSQDFAGDLEAAKAAGFRTNGPPEWRWHAPSPGIKALNRLRKNRPQSGLTITEEALAIYKPLAEAEAKNAEVRTKLAEEKKKAKKERKNKELESTGNSMLEGLTSEKWWIGAEDLPPAPPFKSAYIPPTPPELKCFVCHQPLYPYEYTDVAMCLWCAKTSEK